MEKFLSSHQDAGENASEYLQRLQATLSAAIRRGGVSEASVNQQLFKKFIRGCWDQTLLLTLQQKIKMESSPDFSELLLQLRMEEERRAVKMDRMQRHLGGSKVKPSLHLQEVKEASNRTTVVQITEKRTQRRKKQELKTTTRQEPSLTAAEVQLHQHAPRPEQKLCAGKMVILPGSVKMLPTRT